MRQSYFSVKCSVNIALEPSRGIKGSNLIPKQGQRLEITGDKQIPFITFAHSLQPKKQLSTAVCLGTSSSNFWQYFEQGLLIRCKGLKLYFPNKQLTDENITIIWTQKTHTLHQTIAFLSYKVWRLWIWTFVALQFEVKGLRSEIRQRPSSGQTLGTWLEIHLKEESWKQLEVYLWWPFIQKYGNKVTYAPLMTVSQLLHLVWEFVYNGCTMRHRV